MSVWQMERQIKTHKLQYKQQKILQQQLLQQQHHRHHQQHEDEVEVEEEGEEDYNVSLFYPYNTGARSRYSICFVICFVCLLCFVCFVCYLFGIYLSSLL